MLKIYANRIKCKKCGDVLESSFTHDFRFCTCGAIAVDGGHEYLKRYGNPEDIEDLAVYEEVGDVI